ncbi:hypothetical protein [Treponema sp. R6D11]
MENGNIYSLEIELYPMFEDDDQDSSFFNIEITIINKNKIIIDERKNWLNDEPIVALRMETEY